MVHSDNPLPTYAKARASMRDDHAIRRELKYVMKKGMLFPADSQIYCFNINITSLHLNILY